MIFVSDGTGSVGVVCALRVGVGPDGVVLVGVTRIGIGSIGVGAGSVAIGSIGVDSVGVGVTGVDSACATIGDGRGGGSSFGKTGAVSGTGGSCLLGRLEAVRGGGAVRGPGSTGGGGVRCLTILSLLTSLTALLTALSVGVSGDSCRDDEKEGAFEDEA